MIGISSDQRRRRRASGAAVRRPSSARPVGSGTACSTMPRRVTHYHEQPMREARKVDDLSLAVAADIAEEQRHNEGGGAIR